MNHVHRMKLYDNDDTLVDAMSEMSDIDLVAFYHDTVFMDSRIKNGRQPVIAGCIPNNISMCVTRQKKLVHAEIERRVEHESSLFPDVINNKEFADSVHNASSVDLRNLQDHILSLRKKLVYGWFPPMKYRFMSNGDLIGILSMHLDLILEEVRERHE